jgi:hypothetical protein
MLNEQINEQINSNFHPASMDPSTRVLKPASPRPYGRIRSIHCFFIIWLDLGSFYEGCEFSWQMGSAEQRVALMEARRAELRELIEQCVEKQGLWV